MKNLLKKLVTTTLLCTLFIGQTHTMSLSPFAKTVLKNIPLVSLTFFSKMIPYGETLFWATFLATPVLNKDLLDLREDGFVDACKTNDWAYIKNLNDWLNHNQNIEYYLYYKNFAGLRAALELNNFEVIQGLLFLCSKNILTTFKETIEAELGWAALTNNDLAEKQAENIIKTLQLYCAYYDTFLKWNLQALTTDDNLHLLKKLSLPHSTQTLIEYFTCACLFGHDTLAQYLVNQLKIRDKKFDVNTVNYKQESLLHRVAENNDASIVKILVKSGHHLENKNQKGHTPLEVAWHNNSHDAAKELQLLISEKRYKKNRYILAERFNKNNFQQKEIVDTIMNYTTKDDFKPHVKEKSIREQITIGLM